MKTNMTGWHGDAGDTRNEIVWDGNGSPVAIVADEVPVDEKAQVRDMLAAAPDMRDALLTMTAWCRKHSIYPDGWDAAAAAMAKAQCREG